MLSIKVAKAFTAKPGCGQAVLSKTVRPVEARRGFAQDPKKPAGGPTAKKAETVAPKADSKVKSPKEVADDLAKLSKGDVAKKLSDLAVKVPRKIDLDPMVVARRRMAELMKAAGLSSETATVADLERLLKSNPEFGKALRTYREYRKKTYHFGADGLLKDGPKQRAPVRVAVTGASGAIGYALLFRIASGQMLGSQQPVILQLLELPQAMNALQGVVMELQDCAFPLLHSVVTSDDPNKAFAGADYAVLVGAKPRTKGQERGDLLKENGKIFEVQGKALNDNASKDVKVLVVGNPANTNAMITSHFAPKIAPQNITAMTRLDHNRGLAQLALKTGAKVTDIQRFCIWGNHSATQYPDISHTQIAGKWARDVIKDDKWVREKFIPAVQQRGAAIIAARGASSAASAASSAVDHMRDWVAGTGDAWTSMAVPSDGAYGVDKGLWYSFPVTTELGGYTVVGNVTIDEFSAQMMEATRKELVQERNDVAAILKQ